MKSLPNKAPHLIAIPLRFIVAGELGRYPFFYFWINPEYSKTFFCYSRSLFDQLHLISKPFMV